MKRAFIILAVAFSIGAALGVIGVELVNAHHPPIYRTEVLRTDLAGTAGKEVRLWVTEIYPGGATGKYYHPTPRFVYVLEGSVTLEVDGQLPRTFRAGDAFQERPDDVQKFKNASPNESAKALAFQIAEKGEPLEQIQAPSPGKGL